MVSQSTHIEALYTDTAARHNYHHYNKKQVQHGIKTIKTSREYNNQDNGNKQNQELGKKPRPELGEHIKETLLNTKTRKIATCNN